jgi:hypothetical protein
MKRIVFFLLICYVTNARGQQQKEIEYDSGRIGLTKLMAKSIRPEKYSDSAAWYSTDKQYLVLLRIEKNGVLGDDISIFMSNDSLMLPMILDVMRRTQGHWINHTGKEQMVVLPICYFFQSDEKEKPMPILRFDKYNKTGKEAMVYLEPFTIVMYPPMR